MSIRRRLLIGLTAGLLLLFAISASAFYFYIRAVLTCQFDAALSVKARALSSMVNMQSNGEVDLDMPQRPLPNASAAPSFEFFEVWRDDGTVIARAPALGKMDLPRAGSFDPPVFSDTRLPDGRPGRVITLRFVPNLDPESTEDPVRAKKLAAEAAAMNVVAAVAQDRGELDRVLAALLSALLVASLLVIAGTLCVVAIVVRQGLQPLEKVARDASQIDAQSLTFRFSLRGLPGELQPICQRLNETLDRLHDAFTRERRFSADVAHELRTPIAELRALADVAMKFDGDRETSLSYFRDAGEIARQMERIVTKLLSLARCHAGAMAVASEAVDVADLVRQAWRSCEPSAASRNLNPLFDLPMDFMVHTDRNMLETIVGNLLANAVEYATAGGSLFCKANRNGQQWMIVVVNDTVALSKDDLPHLFEPFWRKDAARTDGSHCGLGLTLVEAYVKLLDGTVEAAMPEAGSFCVTVRMPQGAFETSTRQTPALPV
jgi:two-component system sensor histidine kinase QseC